MTQADMEKAILDLVSKKDDTSQNATNPFLMQQMLKPQDQSPYQLMGEKTDPMQQYWLMQNFKGDTNDPMAFQQLQAITGKQSVSVLGLALGVALSSFIGSIFARFLPLGGLTVPIAGFVLMRIFKTGIMRDIAVGILVAGVGSFLGGLVGGVTGGLGGLLGGVAPAAATNGGSLLAPGEVA